MKDTRSQTQREPKQPVTSTSRLIRRQRVFLVILGVAAALAIAGLVASLFIKSPAQRAAEALPPSPSTLTAKVENSVLAQTVVVRGTVTAAGQFAVSGTLGWPGGPAVLTKLPLSVGGGVGEGQQLAEVGGQPIFAFSGVVPAYRDIKVDTKGEDVAQLQYSLQNLGYLSSSDQAGVFTLSDARALGEFMKDKGYDPPLDAQKRPMMPLCQIVFLPALPATVASVGATVGQNLAAAQQPLLKITTGELNVTATVPSGSQNGLSVGQKLMVSDDVRGKSVDGTIASLGGFSAPSAGGAGTNGSSSSGSATNQGAQAPGYLLVARPDTALSSDWLGQDVRVTIVVATTPGPQLIVPVTAVTTQADGQASVTVLAADGTRSRVPVTTGLTNAGKVAVTPLTPGALSEGGDVVVG